MARAFATVVPVALRAVPLRPNTALQFRHALSLPCFGGFALFLSWLLCILQWVHVHMLTMGNFLAVVFK